MEVGLVGLFGMAIFMFRVIVQMVMQMFIFRSGLNKHLVHQASKAMDFLKALHGIVCLGFGIACIILCRSEVYDTLIFTFEIINLSMLTLVVAILSKFTGSFLQILAKQQNSQDTPEKRKEAFKDINQRIRTMARRWGVSLGLFPIFAIVGFSVRLIINSLPYMFAIFIVAWFLTPSLTVGVISLFPRIVALHSVSGGERSDQKNQSSNNKPAERIRSSKDSSKIDCSAIDSKAEISVTVYEKA